MTKIGFEISNDGDKCGRCATIRKRKYGDGEELEKYWCERFGKFLPDDFETGMQNLERLPECIATKVDV